MDLMVIPNIDNENLVIESLNIGTLSKTPCAICYLKNVANSDLVNEVHYRLSNLKIDHLTSSGQLEELIQDDKRFSFPQIISTERPDKTTNLIFDGRVAIIVNGSPYILIAPATFSDFLLSPEDLNLKHQYSNFVRFLRFSAYIIAILLELFLSNKLMARIEITPWGNSQIFCSRTTA